MTLPKLLNYQNQLFCIVTKKDSNPKIEEDFVSDISTYLNSTDGEYIAGYDYNNQSIFLTYIDRSKVLKMVDFFKRYNVLDEFIKVDNVMKFINSDIKYSELYLEESNKVMLNNYIRYNVSVDDVLERIFESSMKSLFPIELEILKQKKQVPAHLF
jgi:hypothetical protein